MSRHDFDNDDILPTILEIPVTYTELEVLYRATFMYSIKLNYQLASPNQKEDKDTLLEHQRINGEVCDALRHYLKLAERPGD